MWRAAAASWDEDKFRNNNNINDKNKSEMPGEGEVAEHFGHFNCFYIFQHDCMSRITLSLTDTHTHTRSQINTCILHCLLYPAMNNDASTPPCPLTYAISPFFQVSSCWCGHFLFLVLVTLFGLQLWPIEDTSFLCYMLQTLHESKDALRRREHHIDCH